MALCIKGKQALVAKVNSVAVKAVSVVVADYSGVNCNAISDLRKHGRENGVKLLVVRKTLARRAFYGTSFDCFNLNSTLVGTILIAFSLDHPGAGARMLKQLNVKALAYSGELIPAAQIDRLALLPTLNEAFSKVMKVIKEASVGKLVRTLAALSQ